MYHELRALLILSVTAILLALILKGNLSVWTIIAVLLVLVVLIMVIGGATSKLVDVLQVMQHFIRDLLT
jgi:hypothetical protein